MELLLPISRRVDCRVLLAVLAISRLYGRSRSRQRSADQGYHGGHGTGAYWGPDPAKYAGWTNHSNRLIPAYTFGIDLDRLSRRAQRLSRCSAAGRTLRPIPPDTLNPQAEYFDQTDMPACNAPR